MSQNNQARDFLIEKRNNISERLIEILEGQAFEGLESDGTVFALRMESLEEERDRLLRIIDNIAVKNHSAVAVFTTKMSREQWVNLMICFYTGVNEEKLRSCKLNEMEWAKMIECFGVLTNAPIYIDDSQDVSISGMLSKCKCLKEEHGLSLVVIDNPYKEKEVDNSGVSTDELKHMAKELEVPLLLA